MGLVMLAYNLFFLPSAQRLDEQPENQASNVVKQDLYSERNGSSFFRHRSVTSSSVIRCAKNITLKFVSASASVFFSKMRNAWFQTVRIA